MAKKSFVVAPPPKALSAADLGFINNGPGKDNVPAEAEVRLAFVLPVSLHIRFKSISATRRIKMADELRLFVERRTANSKRVMIDTLKLSKRHVDSLAAASRFER